MSDDMYFKLDELNNITNSFSEDHKVGSGGFGDVYKGVHKGKVIAIKRINQLQGLDDKQFDNEFLNLIKVNHPIIVKLLGYCHSSDRKYVEHGGRKFFASVMERILCFEYMHGGSLEKHIKADDSCDLDWATCYQIIKGTCEGINHLHTAYEQPIFHMDLKPANILLDNNKQAKIADLGLSKLVEKTQTYKTQAIQGTQGFMPPEFVDGGYVSPTFDVFSLGVIIIKLMDGDKGRTRFHDMGPEQFVEHVCENWRNKLQEKPVHLSHKIETLQVKTCIEMALRCVAANRKERPSIKDVIYELEKLEAEIKKISLPSEESQVLTVQRSCDSNILAVDPTLELRFIFEPRKDISCCLQLTNITDQFIAFNIKTDKTKYKTQPSKGVMPPCSKGYINVTLLAQDEVLLTMKCNDMFLVQSVNVEKDLMSNEITEDFFQEAMKEKVLDVVKLPIVYIGLDQFSSN